MNGHYFSGLLLAWELVSGPDQASVEELSLAKEMVAQEPVDYFDQVRILETKAAVAAAQADFETALRLQKQAIETAERLEWDLRDVNHRREANRRGEKWSGPYFYEIELDPAQHHASAG